MSWLSVRGLPVRALPAVALLAFLPRPAPAAQSVAVPGEASDPDTTAVRASPELDEARRAAALLATGLLRESSLPALSVTVGVDGRVVFSEAIGHADLATRSPATPLTRFRIGSIGKGLTATGAMLLAERGRLDLDAPIGRYIASLPPELAGATARQLAGHLAGVRHYRQGEGISHTGYADVMDALELFVDDSLVAAPGVEYEYSTYGYTLLSAVMQRAAGEPFLEWMRSNVFDPLGLRSTGADFADSIVPDRASFYHIVGGRLVPARFTDNSYKWAGGGFLSTSDDLVRFGLGLLDGELLTRDGVRTLFTSQRTAAGEETGYGMGFRPRSDWDGRRVVHHGGSSEGGRAFFLLYPEERVAVAMAANRSTAPLFEEEAQSVAHFFLDHGPGSDAAIDEELAGEWSLSGELGDDAVAGTLRLYATGESRGILEWGEDETPIRIVVVDRHGDEMLLFGVGPHGVMNMWLSPADVGWHGRWEYLGRRGAVRLGGAPEAALRCWAPGVAASADLAPVGAGVRSPAVDDGSRSPAPTLRRARRTLTKLRPKVRFTNRPSPPMGLMDRLARYDVPGVAIAVIDGGAVAWSCAAGVRRTGRVDPVTVATLFHAKSIAKPVSAIAALRLVDAGRLALDEPLVRRLRSYRVPDNEHTREEAPTLRHVLSHSAGFTRGGVDSYRPDEPLPTLVESLEGRPPADVDPLGIDFTPGTRSRYSGGGYGVLQALLSDITDRAFPALVDSLVFDPVGMEHSIFPQPLPEALEPFSADGHDSDGELLPGGYETLPIMAAGGLWTTAPDLARFVLAVEDAWAGNAREFLDPALAREMLTRQVDDWGLGFEIDGHDGITAFRHTGSGDGFKALIIGYLGRGQGAVVLANGDGAGELRYEILRSIAEEYDWPGYRETVTHTLAEDVDPADLRPAVGTYEWASGIRTRVALRDGALHERFDEGAWQRLFPLSNTEFVSLSDVRYRFLLDDAGRVTGLELEDGTGTYRAERVPETD